MNSMLLGALLLGFFACALMQNICSRQLRLRIASSDPVHPALFRTTNPWLANGRRIPALRLKYALPWVRSPNLPLDPVAARYLRLCRACVYVSVVDLLLVVLLVLLSQHL